MSATPTIYFIDDSATMREVIKIAFRRENINVVAHHDAAQALIEIEKTRPDIVITDVIMPDKDGYDVCQYIKSHPELARTPVVLMSGVVNRAVAEKAFAVKADELLRKPFQPQDLIARVKHLLKPNGTPKPAPAAVANAAAALTSIFSAAAPARPVGAMPASQRAVALISEEPGGGPGFSPARPPAPIPAFQSPAPTPAPAKPTFAPGATQPVAALQPAPAVMPAAAPATFAVPAAAPVAPVAPMAAVSAAKPATANDSARLKIEILRLEGLVRKLQSELQGEREYSRSLETHIKSLQETTQ